MVQILLPDGDNAPGGWRFTPLWSDVDDDSTVNPTGDGAEIESDNVNGADTSIAELSLAPGSDPQTSTGHVLRVRWNTNHPSGGFNPARVTLRQGTTVIATMEATLSGQTEVETTYTLTGTEADSITSYSDLNIQLQGFAGFRRMLVDLVELETPDPPAGLNAPGSPSATADSTDQITVDWTDTNTAEDGYRVERSPAGQASWVDVSGNLAADTVQYVDTGLDPGTSYDYRIFAFDGGGDGPASSTVSARTDSEQIGSLPVAAVIGQWDARDLPGSATDPVASWPDVGPKAQNPLAQATASKQPVLEDHDGIRWVLFDGIDDILVNTLDQSYDGDFALILVTEPLTYPTDFAAVLFSTGFVVNLEKNMLAIDDVEALWPNGAWVVMSGDGTQGEHYHGTNFALDSVIPGTRFAMSQLVRNAGEQKLWEGSGLVINEADAGGGDSLNNLAGMFLGMREDETRPTHMRVGFLLLVDMSLATESELLSARDTLMTEFGIGLSGNITDPIGITDQVDADHTQVVDETIVDPIGVADTGGYTASNDHDSISITDEVSYEVLTAEVGSVTDNVSIADDVSYELHAIAERTIVDNVSIVDEGQAFPLYTDVVGITDEVTYELFGAGNLVDDVGITDEGEYSLSADRDPVLITDLVEYNHIVGGQVDRSVLDDIGVADSLDRLVSSSREKVDPVAVTDEIIGELISALDRVIADDVSIQDVLLAAVESARELSETVTLSDVVSAVLTAADESVVTDSIALSDVLSALSSALREVSDSVGITDSITYLASGVETLADLIGITDSVLREVASQRDLADSVSIEDERSAVLDAARLIADEVLLSDTIEVQQGTLEQLQDLVNVLDELGYTAEALRTTIDPVGVADHIAAVVEGSRLLSDPISLTDFVIASIGLSASPLVDEITITDVVEVEAGHDRRRSDTVAITDETEVSRIIRALIVDEIGTTDSIQTSSSGGVNDAVFITDEIEWQLDYRRALVDTMFIEDDIDGDIDGPAYQIVKGSYKVQGVEGEWGPIIVKGRFRKVRGDARY